MTTIQKFFEKTNVLSKKENIIVIADEAHRSHNNIEIDETYDYGKHDFILKKGYAYFLREAFPNAKFIGFTGTPLLKDDKTKEIFGNIIDKYTMEQAEIDEAVVPIKYQKNTIQRTLKEDVQKIKELDEIYQNETENEMRFISQSQKAKIRTQLNNFYKSYSDPKTISTIVTKFWFDYNQRKNILHGKAMFVAFNRQVAVKIYKEMISQNPEFKEKIKLVISNSNKDSEEILEITKNINENEIAREFKNPDSKIKILVVVDKLLTGYDVPDLDTIYIFKVIKFHNLMQTVARVNRTYSDNKNKKEYGLVVDYIGIAQHLEQALIQYSNFSNENKSNFNVEITITKLKDLLLEVRKQHFLENNIYQYWLIEQDNIKRINIIKNAVNHIGKLDSDIKNNFLEKVSKINKWYKVCVQKLDIDSKKEFFLYNTIFKIIRKSNVEDSIDLTKTLEKLKNQLSDLIEVNNVNFEIVPIKNLRTLSEFSKWIKNKRKIEKSLFSETDKIQVVQEIKEQIKKFRNIDPIESQRLSESLRKYIDQLNKKIMTMDEFLDELEKFLEFMQKQEKNVDKLQDKKWLLPFFNILVKPEIREKISKNSDEELVELVYKIWKILEKYIDKRWFENNLVRSKAIYEISTMLFKEYNYPPNDPTNPSNLIIDELKNNITIIKKHKERIMYEDEQRNNN